MWTPPDTPTSSQARYSTADEGASTALDWYRPADWPSQEEMAVWAQMPSAPQDGPANASLLCGGVSLAAIALLAVLALVFRTDAAHHERLLLAGVVLGEEALVPSVLAIYFARVAQSERFDQLLSDVGRMRSIAGLLIGYISLVAIASAAIALLLASGR